MAAPGWPWDPHWKAKTSKKTKGTEILMEHAGLHPLGIQHVIECPALEPWIQKWSSSSGVDKEEAEQTIRALFVDTSVKVIFIPVFGMEEEKKRELRRNVKEWNRGDTRPKCEST